MRSGCRRALSKITHLVRSFLTETHLGGVVQAQVYATVEAEVRGALAQVKALLVDGTAPEQMAVVARDDAFYGPTAFAVAWEFGLPLRALYAIPLAETRVGSWLRLALEVARDDFPYESTLRLLGHPLGPGIQPELWKVIRRRRPGGLAEWQATGVDLSGFTWPTRDARGAYVQRLRELIQNDDVRNQAAPWAREMLACNLLWENLGELENPADAATSFETFVSDIGEILGLLTVPMAPGRVGVELHTPLSLYGARYQHVFALGLAEGVFPQPVQDDLVLDFHDRKRLLADGVTLEAPASAAAREQLSFVAMLLATTDRLTLSYPQLVGDQAGLPSLFLRALKLDRDAERSPALVASTEELRRISLRWPGAGGAAEDPVAQQARRAWVVERGRESSDPPDEFDGVTGETLDPEQWRFSASQLVEIGQCAFKWFAARLLRLAEWDEAAPDLPPSRRGELYHKTLELGLKRARGNGGVREALLACLEEVFAEAEAELELSRLSAWPARRATHLLVLRRAIEGSDFVRPDAEVAREEGEFAGEWHGLSVTGRVDRVDRTPAGLILMDYKASGSAPSGAQNDQGKALLDVQLPLYREVAVPSFFPGESVVDAYYYSLTKAEKLSVAASDETALAALVERVKGHLRAGSYPVAPDVDQKACDYCPYDSVCRRGPRLLRKRAAAP